MRVYKAVARLPCFWGVHAQRACDHRPCERMPVQAGWVDGHKYLVYRNESRQFIFDPVTQRRALLLGDFAGSHVW